MGNHIYRFYKLKEMRNFHGLMMEGTTTWSGYGEFETINFNEFYNKSHYEDIVKNKDDFYYYLIKENYEEKQFLFFDENKKLIKKYTFTK